MLKVPWNPGSQLNTPVVETIPPGEATLPTPGTILALSIA